MVEQDMFGDVLEGLINLIPKEQDYYGVGKIIGARVIDHDGDQDSSSRLSS
ncbi:hypothetical protein KEJ51_05955 [Candidatus Bathyarchaeota archaeon]|nr:hypothetical protein [Candidatus Bathyarchaeota archaeon]MBS7629765.1 hypothetical protein [Candidatus Bathyarchaeota archaeon]